MRDGRSLQSVGNPKPAEPAALFLPGGEEAGAYMRRALELAREALGRTSPNPAVGAVIVREGRIVGEGYTQPPGQAHAEIVALRQAGEEARGATMFVTLEPCAHWGRTPPCAPALIAAGIAAVHIATLDVNPLTGGRGVEGLRAAGIAVHIGQGEAEARELNEAFFKYIATGQPFVTTKYAMTLDGKIATARGHSRWITGPQARALVHRLRSQSDAVLVGVGTIIADNPQLTARGEEPERHQPLRVIVDSAARVPLGAQVVSGLLPGKTLIATTPQAPAAKLKKLQAQGVEVLVVPAKEGLVDLRRLVEELGRREVTSVLLEGGGTLIAAALAEGLVDKVLAFIAPKVVGGASAPTPVAGEGIPDMGQALPFRLARVERIGDDVLLVAYPETGS